MENINSAKSSIVYSCQKKPTPEEIQKIRERVNDPYSLTGIDLLRAFYEWRGLEFDENMFDDIIREYSLNH